ncbi:hypothetical protein BJV74DRAFT_101911 [Russula compacta]|nr:hypothetical protein BJV74DRAFT_101911 [Russula compacta]
MRRMSVGVKWHSLRCSTRAKDEGDWRHDTYCSRIHTSPTRLILVLIRGCKVLLCKPGFPIEPILGFMANLSHGSYGIQEFFLEMRWLLLSTDLTLCRLEFATSPALVTFRWPQPPSSLGCPLRRDSEDFKSTSTLPLLFQHHPPPRRRWSIFCRAFHSPSLAFHRASKYPEGLVVRNDVPAVTLVIVRFLNGRPKVPQ